MNFRPVVLFSLLVSAVLSSAPAMADELQEGFAPVPQLALPFSWEELKAYVQGCAEMPVSYSDHGQKQYGTLRSTCHDLKVFGNTAQFELAGSKYYAELLVSRFADGEDLNDLIIRNEKGVALGLVSNVLSYGDIILALALGDDRFREVAVTGFEF